LNDCIILSKTQTNAQQMIRLLKKNGISATLSRTPRELSVSGCAASVAILSANLTRAIELLRKNDFTVKRVYLRSGDGLYSEYIN